ncbi:MAG: hypothetical protein FWG18_00420 [Alphaproteobacteria bacterium]|nr:hypothetical protein [Alphaproteobacteria bacterium]
MKKHYLLFVGCSLLFLSACSTTARRLDTVRDEFANGNFENQKIGDRNLDPLLQGNALFQQDRFNEADRQFEDINRRMPDIQQASILGEAAKALSSQMANSYKPYFMDDLFISYYQIWAALAEGRMSDARVIINQSYAKQQRLSNEFASLIRERQRDNNDNGLGAQLRAENSQWAAFTDIMNPALTYLSGVYFLNIASSPADFENARQFLVRANGMVSRNTYIRADLDAAVARRRPTNTAWIFIESGFAPRLTERRIDWPMFIGNRVQAISIATAEPVFLSGATRPDGAELLADVDAMFMTEFNEYSVNQALRALASAVSKAVLQATANKQLGPWGGLAATVYSIASTGAEIRSWVTLPKQIFIWRVDKESSKFKVQSSNNDVLIELRIGGNVLSEIRVSKTGNDLIYIRLTNDRPEPKIIKLN